MSDTRGATGRRSRDQRQAISTAILSLMREGGHSALTTDAVAHLAGVSKATIYTMWSSKSELLIAAASQVLVSPENVDRGSFRAEIEYILRDRAAQYNAEHEGHLFAALLGATAADPDLRSTFSEWVTEQMDANTAAVRRGIERGEVRPDCDPKAISTLIAGPLIYRMVIERQPVDESLIQLVIESALSAASVSAATSGEDQARDARGQRGRDGELAK